MRINRLRNIEMAKRNAERLKNPASFPSVPKGDLWAVELCIGYARNGFAFFMIPYILKLYDTSILA